MPTGIYKRTEEHGKRISEGLMGHRPWSKGKKFPNRKKAPPISEKHRKNLSLAGIGNTHGFKKGHVPWNKERRGYSIHTIESRRKMSEIRRGEKSRHLWKGGITPINDTIRKSLEYKLWRDAVFKRDDYTCQKCKKRGGRLQVDHIKPFAFYPELRFELSNGRILCNSCHKLTPTYLNRWYETHIKTK